MAQEMMLSMWEINSGEKKKKQFFYLNTENQLISNGKSGFHQVLDVCRWFTGLISLLYQAKSIRTTRIIKYCIGSPDCPNLTKSVHFSLTDEQFTACCILSEHKATPPANTQLFSSPLTISSSLTLLNSDLAIAWQFFMDNWFFKLQGTWH